MKNLAWARMLLILSFLITGNLASGQFEPGKRFSDEWADGSATNGIWADVGINWSESTNVVPDMTVSVYTLNPELFFGGKMPDPHAPIPLIAKIFGEGLLYYIPTNLFCGPVELRDPKGALLPSKKPDPLRESYPPSFSIAASKKARPDTKTVYPYHLASSGDLLARFHIGDYFDINGPGVYKVTVQPMIYKRESTKSDICSRIELPPVTVSFNWSGQPGK